MEERVPEFPSHSSKARHYRDRATTCGRLVAHARSAADRERLLRMRDACLTLAATQDWLDGLPPTPPSNASALMMARPA
jgi:hypothetical protein